MSHDHYILLYLLVVMYKLKSQHLCTRVFTPATLGGAWNWNVTGSEPGTRNSHIGWRGLGDRGEVAESRTGPNPSTDFLYCEYFV